MEVRVASANVLTCGPDCLGTLSVESPALSRLQLNLVRSGGENIGPYSLLWYAVTPVEQPWSGDIEATLGALEADRTVVVVDVDAPTWCLVLCGANPSALAEEVSALILGCHGRITAVKRVKPVRGEPLGIVIVLFEPPNSFYQSNFTTSLVTLLHGRGGEARLGTPDRDGWHGLLNVGATPAPAIVPLEQAQPSRLVRWLRRNLDHLHEGSPLSRFVGRCLAGLIGSGCLAVATVALAAAAELAAALSSAPPSLGQALTWLRDVLPVD